MKKNLWDLEPQPRFTHTKVSLKMRMCRKYDHNLYTSEGIPNEKSGSCFDWPVWRDLDFPELNLYYYGPQSWAKSRLLDPDRVRSLGGEGGPKKIPAITPSLGGWATQEAHPPRGGVGASETSVPRPCENSLGIKRQHGESNLRQRAT